MFEDLDGSLLQMLPPSSSSNPSIDYLSNPIEIKCDNGGCSHSYNCRQHLLCPSCNTLNSMGLDNASLDKEFATRTTEETEDKEEKKGGTGSPSSSMSPTTELDGVYSPSNILSSAADSARVHRLPRGRDKLYEYMSTDRRYRLMEHLEFDEVKDPVDGSSRFLCRCKYCPKLKWLVIDVGSRDPRPNLRKHFRGQRLPPDHPKVSSLPQWEKDLERREEQLQQRERTLNQWETDLRRREQDLRNIAPTQSVRHHVEQQLHQLPGGEQGSRYTDHSLRSEGPTEEFGAGFVRSDTELLPWQIYLQHAEQDLQSNGPPQQVGHFNHQPLNPSPGPEQDHLYGDLDLKSHGQVEESNPRWRCSCSAMDPITCIRCRMIQGGETGEGQVRQLELREERVDDGVASESDEEPISESEVEDESDDANDDPEDSTTDRRHTRPSHVSTDREMEQITTGLDAFDLTGPAAAGSSEIRNTS